MGDPKYRATGGGLAFDAFYRDEWGVVNDSTNCAQDATERKGFHKNVFTTVSTAPALSETSQTFFASFTNSADPHVNAGLKEKSNPVPDGSTSTFTLRCYCSDSVTAYWKSLAGKPWEKPINLTLYFGVGTEINRHGMRSSFKDQPNMQAVMQIQGIEKPRFGISIDDAQIKRALATFFGVTVVPYRIKVLAAFSTGSCGLNQALLNDLVDVTAVERLVFYDCLYAQQCGNTAAAIKRLKGRASSTLKIVVYKTSEGGNSFKAGDFTRLSVVVDNPGLIPSQGIVANMFQNTSYISLVIFRALEAAVADGVVALTADNRTPFSDMAALMAGTPRGHMISNKTTFKFVHGSVPGSGITIFDDWARTNTKVINAFTHKVGRVSASGSFRDLLWNNSIPGWPGGDGEDKHDLLIPEFGWEYLPY